MYIASRHPTRFIVLFLVATTLVLPCCEMNTDEMEIDDENIRSRKQGLVEYSYFSGHSREGGILLAWGTRSETNTAGFNLFRKKTEQVDYTTVNETLIAAKSPAGAEYEYFDHPLEPGSYDYQMEEVDNEGKATPHGGSFTVTVFGDDDDQSRSLCSTHVTGPRTNRTFTRRLFALLFDMH